SMARLEKQGNVQAALVNQLRAKRERLIGALLLGNNAVNILASSLATSLFLLWFGDVGVIYATFVMTVLVVIFAEVLPKTIAINVDDPPEEIVRAALASTVTRLPLWRDTPENIVGVLHAKDLLRALYAAQGDLSKIDILGIALEPWFVPDTTPLFEQLKA